MTDHTKKTMSITNTNPAGLLADTLHSPEGNPAAWHHLVIKGASGTTFTLRFWDIHGFELPSLACELGDTTARSIAEELTRTGITTILGDNHNAWVSANGASVPRIAGIGIQSVGGAAATAGMTASSNKPLGIFDGATWTITGDPVDTLTNGMAFGQVPDFFTVDDLAAPMNGATNISFASGTWTTTQHGTRNIQSTATTAPDTRYSTLNDCYSAEVVITETAGYNLGCQFEFTTPLTMNDPNVGVLIYFDQPQTTPTNDFGAYTMRVRMSVDAAANTYTNIITANRYLPCNRWSFMKMSGIQGGVASTGFSSAWAVTGTINTDDTYKRIDFFLSGASGITPKIYIRQLSYGGNDPKVVTIRFDDNLESFDDVAYPILLEYGLVADHYVISSTVGTGGYMTLAQMQGLSPSVVNWCNHTASHWATATAVSKTALEIQADIETCRDYLIANGLNRRDSAYHLAAPFGVDLRLGIEDEYREGALAAGMLTLGSTAQGIEGYGLADPYHLPCYFIGNDTEVNKMRPALALLRQLEMSSGGVLTFGFHKIGTGTASTDCSVARFTEFCQLLRELIDNGVVKHCSVLDLWDRRDTLGDLLIA